MRREGEDGGQRQKIYEGKNADPPKKTAAQLS
jgi:hypothetical protein